MEFSEIAEEIIDELAGNYEYDGLGEIAYFQTVTDLANYAFEKWDTALFVAFEDVIETELRRRGYVPTH